MVLHHRNDGKKNFNSLCVAILAFVTGICFLTFPVQAIDQPAMKAARNNLNKAQNEIRKATSDKGGHRAKAIQLVERAIEEVNKGITYDRRHSSDQPGGFIFNGDFGGAANSFDQPHMQRAKDYLQDALNNLERATHDKGGHRAKAMELTRETIEQVNKGIAYDRRN